MLTRPHKEVPKRSNEGELVLFMFGCHNLMYHMTVVPVVQWIIMSCHKNLKNHTCFNTLAHTCNVIDNVHVNIVFL